MSSEQLYKNKRVRALVSWLWVFHVLTLCIFVVFLIKNCSFQQLQYCDFHYKFYLFIFGKVDSS